MKSITISTSMGPGIKLDESDVTASVQIITNQG